MPYSYGSNWSRTGSGGFANGRGQAIRSPGAYFSAVASNSRGYNDGYTNGHGTAIRDPGAYYSTVAKDSYGYAAGASSSGGKGSGKGS